MRSKQSFRPVVASLEERLAPAIAVTTPINGNGDTDLVITSVAPGVITSDLRVWGGVDAGLAPSANTYVVSENFGPLVAYGPITGNVRMNLSAVPASLNPLGVNVDFALLNGEELEGDLSILFAANLGGSHLVGIEGIAGIFGSGAIIGGPPANPGNVSITTGTGFDSVYLGFAPISPVGSGSIDVNGSVAINTGAGNDFVGHFGGTIANHATFTNVNQFDSGFSLPTLIEGNFKFVNVTDTANVTNNVVLHAGATVNGNATIQTNTRNDNVTINGSIYGNATLSLAAGGNSFTLGGGALVNGSLSFTSGNQRDVVNLDAGSTVLGNASFSLGSSGSTSALANVLNLNGAMWGSVLNVAGGNGRDEVAFNGFAQGAYLKAYLYSGNDDFTLGGSAVLLRALVDGGFGTDTFTSALPLIAFPMLLKSFP